MRIKLPFNPLSRRLFFSYCMRSCSISVRNMSHIKLAEIQLPAAVIHSEFAGTNFDGLDDLSNQLAYCFEGAHADSTVLVDCNGWAYEIAECTEYKQKFLSRLFIGRQTRYELELNRTRRLSMSDFHGILTRRLRQNPDWWMNNDEIVDLYACLLYTSPSPRDLSTSRMPSSA